MVSVFTPSSKPTLTSHIITITKDSIIDKAYWVAKLIEVQKILASFGCNAELDYLPSFPHVSKLGCLVVPK